MSENLPATPRPSAALALLRDAIQEGKEGIEVFMVRRHIQSDFAPDVFVFPGGTVKQEDRTLESSMRATAQGGPTALGTGFRAAAIASAQEAGVLLARRGNSTRLHWREQAGSASYRVQPQRKEITLIEIVREGLTLMTTRCCTGRTGSPLRPGPSASTHFFLADAPQGQLAHDD
jgi:hypothetical protein